MTQDARGAEIHVGDTVIYFKTGKFPEKVAGVVEAVDRMVTLGSLDQISPKNKTRANDTTRVYAHSLIVIEALPRVEGRLNTADTRPQFAVPGWGELPEIEPIGFDEYKRRRTELFASNGKPLPETTHEHYDRARHLPDALRQTIDGAVRSHASSLSLYRQMTGSLPWADYLAGYTHTPPERIDDDA